MKTFRVLVPSYGWIEFEGDEMDAKPDYIRFSKGGHSVGMVKALEVIAVQVTDAVGA